MRPLSIVLQPPGPETGRPGAAAAMPRLAVGRVVTARVQAAGGDGLFVLEMEGGRVRARASAGLVPGEELVLVVRDAGPPPVLCPLPPPSRRDDGAAALFSRLLSVFCPDPAGTDAFAAEAVALFGAAAAAPAGPAADPLSLLRLVSFVLSHRDDADPAPARPGRDRDGPGRAERGPRLADLLRALDPGSVHGRALFVFPVLLAGGRGGGAWFLSREGEEGDDAFAVDLFLALSSLGEVRVRLSRSGDAVRVGLWLAGPEARAHVEGMLPSLARALEGAAGRGVKVAVHAAAPECGAEMARLLRGRGAGLVDARA